MRKSPSTASNQLDLPCTVWRQHVVTTFNVTLDLSELKFHRARIGRISITPRLSGWLAPMLCMTSRITKLVRRHMKKIILATTAIALLAGNPIAFAATDDPQAHSEHPWAAERAALLDAWLGGLKAGLKLSADQEKNWPAFESAIRGIAKARADRFHEMREHHDDGEMPSLIDRLHSASDRLAQRSIELKGLADAAAPLYASLDDGQKRTLGILFHQLAHQFRHGGRRWRDHDSHGGE